MKNNKNILSTFLFFIVFLLFVPTLEIKAAWYNNPIDFFNEHVKDSGENIAIYNLEGDKGYFYFSQKGKTRMANVNYYEILGFDFTVEYNGNQWSAGMDIANNPEKSYQSKKDGYTYDLWKFSLDRIIENLRRKHKDVDFSFLYDQNFDSEITFNGIVAHYNYKGEKSGDINEYGELIRGKVATSAYDDAWIITINSEGLPWSPDLSEREALYGIKGTINKNVKPKIYPESYATLIEPNKPGFENLPKTHYHEQGSNEYWVNLKEQFTVYMESTVPNDTVLGNIYPSYNYIQLKGNDSDNNIISKDGKDNFDYYDGFGLNFTDIETESWNKPYGKRNYLFTHFRFRAIQNNKDYKLNYTGVFKGAYDGWRDSDQWLRTDGDPPEIDIYSSEKENVWTRENIEVDVEAIDNRSGLNTIKYWLQKDDNGWEWQGENKGTITLSTSGKHDVIVEAIDNVKNSTGYKSKRYLIDKTTPLGDVVVENITTTGFDLVVKNISDEHSGISKVNLKSWTDESYGEKEEEKNISQGENSIKFRVNTSDYDNKSGAYYYEVIITDKVGNEKKISNTVDVPFPKPIVSEIEISDYEYKDTDKNIYWVKTKDNYTAMVSGKTEPDNVRYKIDSLHAITRKLESTDFSKMRAFDAYIPNYEAIDSKYYDFSLGTNTLNTSIDLGYDSYSIRKNDGYTYSYFDLSMSEEEEIKISPMVRISEAKLDSDWNSYSAVIKSDGTAPTGKVSYDYNENTFDLDISIANIIENGSGVDKIWAELYIENEEDKKITQELINTNNIYKGKIKLFELFPDSIEPIQVVIKAIDKVGNEGELFREVFDPFKIEATITRDWEPYQSILQEGELGVVKVKLFGGIDLVEIEFPVELNKLAEESEEYSQLNTSKYLTPQKKDSFDYKFYVPIGAEHKMHTIKVTGYKNGKKKIVYPNMEVDGNILNKVRTRIR